MSVKRSTDPVSHGHRHVGNYNNKNQHHRLPWNSQNSGIEGKIGDDSWKSIKGFAGQWICGLSPGGIVYLPKKRVK